MLPAGVIQTVDHDEREDLRRPDEGRDQERPEFDDSFLRDEDYRVKLGSYYGDTAGVR